MRGDEKLRQGADLFRRAADRSTSDEAKEHLLHCAGELVQIAEWVEGESSDPMASDRRAAPRQPRGSRGRRR